MVGGQKKRMQPSHRQNTCIPYRIRFSERSSGWVVQGRFILLDHPHKVNLDDCHFSIAPPSPINEIMRVSSVFLIPLRITHCGFRSRGSIVPHFSTKPLKTQMNDRRFGEKLKEPGGKSRRTWGKDPKTWGKAVKNWGIHGES